MSAACPRCRSPREDGDQRCAVCGSPLEVRANFGTTTNVRFLRCTDCSASIEWSVEKAALACAFCDAELNTIESSDPVEAAQQTLGFTVEAEAARAALARWIASLGFFRPSDLAQRAQIEALKPTTWVAWVFDARATISWTADSDYDARRSDWAPHAGQTDLDFDDLCVSASRGLSDEETARLTPSYDLALATEAPELPDDTRIERFDVQRSQARARILAAIEATAATRLQQSGQIPGTRYRNVHVQPLVRELTTRRIAFPAWILAWRYDGQLYRTVISGHDASCLVGQAPWSSAKIAAVIVLGLAAIAAIVATLAL